mgnify:CR=1 FL=1
MSIASLERRVRALETQMARLRRRLQGGDETAGPWWEKIAGCFAGDPLFLEAMKHGRRYRESLRPPRAKRRTR